MAVLRITSGPEEGRVIDLEVGENLVGRGPDARVFVSHSSVSKRHARIEAKCRWFVADLGSRNLTLHNNAEVDPGEPVELEHGDRLSFGEVAAVFDLEKPSSALSDATQALEAATRNLNSMRAELESARMCLKDATATVAQRDALLAEKDTALAELSRRMDPSAYLTREQFEAEKKAFEAKVQSEAQRQVEAFSRRALELEQRYVKAAAQAETLQRTLAEKDQELALLQDRLKAR